MPRDITIDKVKGILVVFMVAVHTVQFLCETNLFTTTFSHYVNLTSFSGFLFCFGYACALAYFGKRERTGKILVGAVKSLLAYFISGFGFLWLVQQDISLLGDMLTFRMLPGYSEFLLSFALLYLIVALANPLLDILSGDGRYVILYCFFTLAMTFFPYHRIHHALPGALIGTEDFYTFPVLQYSGYFILGAWFAKKKTGGYVGCLITALLCSAFFVGYAWVYHDVPSRVPPSFLWVVGASLPICIYYLACRNISLPGLDAGLSFLGRNTLLILVCSNLLIFAVSATIRRSKMAVTPVKVIGVYVFIIAASAALAYLKEYMKGKRRINAV